MKEVYVVTTKQNGIDEDSEVYASKEDALKYFKEIMGILFDELEELEEDSNFDYAQFVKENNGWDARLYTAPINRPKVLDVIITSSSEGLNVMEYIGEEVVRIVNSYPGQLLHA